MKQSRRRSFVCCSWTGPRAAPCVHSQRTTVVQTARCSLECITSVPSWSSPVVRHNNAKTRGEVAVVANWRWRTWCVLTRGAYSTEYRRVVPCVRRAEPVQEPDCFHARFVIISACRTPLLRSAHRYCNDFVQGERSDGPSQDRRRMPDMARCLIHARAVKQLDRFHLGERPRFGRRGWKAQVARVHGVVPLAVQVPLLAGLRACHITTR